MAQYIQLQTDDIQKIADNYNLPVYSFEPIEGGASNTNYLLRTGQGHYVLTVFDNKTSVEVYRIRQLLRLLEKENFAAPRLRPTVKGDITTMFKDKPVLVKAYINGQVCKNLNETMLHQIGTAMARLHAIPAPHFLPDNYPYSLQVFPQIIGQKINPKYESWLADRYDYFRQHIPPDLPRGLIHADLFYDNVLFEEQNLKAIIDFEDVCHYYKVFDLSMGILGLCREGSTIAFNKAQALLMGYQQLRTLEENEKEAMQLLVDYAATVISYWRFWKYCIHIPIKENADKHWEMVHFADAVSAIPPKKFLRLILE